MRSAIRFRHFILSIVLVLPLLLVLPQPKAHAQAFSDYVENQLADFLFRGQTFTPPEEIYVGLSTSACSDSATGTEVSGGNYGRVQVTSSLANWSGTQSPGSTSASSGTGGQISNNAAIEFLTPSAGWGTVSHWFLADADEGGNILICAALATSKTINSGDTVSFPAGALTITLQ